MARVMRRLLVVLVVVIAAVVIALFLLNGKPVAVAPTPTPSPTPIPLDQALLSRRVTFLLLGTDQNASRALRHEPALTDSMIVLSINAAHNRLTMISVPRDTVDVRLPDGSVWHQKLNGLYTQKGLDGMRDTFDGLLGAKIDFVILVNMEDFAAIVNAFGGIELTVPEAIDDATIGLHIKAGRQHLNGKTAQLYSRSRHTTDDFSRAARQQQVLRALLARFNDPKAKIDLPALLGSLHSLKTDIPKDKIPTLAEIARRSRNAKVTAQVLQPPTFYQVRIEQVRGYVLIPNLQAIKRYAAPLLSG
ncbi:MAG: LytR family transcriptional regulator [Chloroflexi bacterium]|nr:MAG: LytR family transcriptional regulator [Chloroflexota bacterium]